MSYKYQVEMTESAADELAKISKSNPKMGLIIQLFLDRKLTSNEDPRSLSNVKKLKGFKDNRYRWRLGNYRVVGIMGKSGNPIIINVIIIGHRQYVYEELKRKGKNEPNI